MKAKLRGGSVQLDGFRQVVDELYLSFNRVPHEPGSDCRRHPEHTGWLLSALGHPDHAYPVVMVTGSKGKGSYAYYLSEILRAHGYSVGLFSSPGLLSDRERIRINGRLIPEAALVATWRAIRPHWQTLLQRLPSGQYVGPVGLFAVIAAQYFRDHHVDWAVIETGRGARFDDVAQIFHPHAVITNILPEHLRELGPTTDEVAWHKLGIVHPETQNLFLGSSSPALTRVMVAQRPTWPRHLITHDLEQAVSIHDRRGDRTGTRFSVRLASGLALSHLWMPAVGPVIDNFGGALAVADRLIRLSPCVVADLTASLSWPGRGEIVSTQPYLVLDASIQGESAKQLVSALGGRFDHAVLSLPNSKDRSGVRSVLEAVTPSIIYTTCSNPYLRYDYGDSRWRAHDRLVEAVSQALDLSSRTASPDARILWMGTISFIADCYRYLNRSAIPNQPLDAPQVPG